MAVATQQQKLAEIADAIREKEGSTGTIVADDFAERILAIPTGPDTSDATATAGDILSPKTAYVDGEKVTGTIATKESADVTVNGATVTTPAGYYKNQVAKSVTTVTHPAPTQALSLGTYATIRATHEQAAGYVSASTTTNDYNITRNAGGTKTPGTSNQTLLSSGLVYLNNPLVMSGSSNLVPSNIRSGVNIFGITGSYSGSLSTITLSFSGSYYAGNVMATNSNGTVSQYIINQGDVYNHNAPLNSLIAIYTFRNSTPQGNAVSWLFEWPSVGAFVGKVVSSGTIYL